MLGITEENEALRFARQELERYGQQVFTDWSTGGHSIDIGLAEKGETVVSEEIDEIYIRVKGGVGRIVGSNPCAVLIAVYRFLRECGCRFLRPGADGEYLPQCLLSEVKVDLCERADMEMRCVVIEGACSYQNVYHMIDFCPKIGLNHYEFQFKTSAVFFERWYDHEKNPYGKPEGLTEERVEQMTAALRAELKKRGIFTAGGDGKGLFIEPIKDGIVAKGVFLTDLTGACALPEIRMSGIDLFLHDIFFQPDVHILRKEILHVGFGKQKVMGDAIRVQGLFNVLGNISDDLVNIRETAAVDRMQAVLAIAAIGDKLPDQ